MKKLIILVLSLFIGISSVSAASVTSTTYDKGHMTISGTGTGQTQIVIFNADKEPIYMTTTNVSDGKYSIVLPEIEKLVDGNYTIKVADYDGEKVSEKEITLSNGTIKNPNTYDSVESFAVLGVISILGIVCTSLYFKKNA